MEELFRQSEALVEDAKRISDELSAYNPGLSSSGRIPLSNIAHSIATIMTEYSRLYSDVNGKIRNGS